MHADRKILPGHPAEVEQTRFPFGGLLPGCRSSCHMELHRTFSRRWEDRRAGCTPQPRRQPVEPDAERQCRGVARSEDDPLPGGHQVKSLMRALVRHRIVSLTNTSSAEHRQRRTAFLASCPEG